MENTIKPGLHRIEIIDILRGFALLGIIIVHFTEQYYAGQPPDSQANFGAKNLTDHITQGLIGIFVLGKFFMIFSFLFGLSFHIQLEKSNDSSSFLFRFGWRLAVLFAIGFLHHLHYRGDILTIYALLGFGLLLCYKLPDKTLLIIAMLLVFNVPSFAFRLYQSVFSQESNPFNADQKELQLYYDTLKSGTYLSILKANLHEFGAKFDFQFWSGRIYITFGLFLLGNYAGRKNFFGSWENQMAWVKKICKKSLLMILGCFIFLAIVFGGSELMGFKLSQALQWAIGGLPYDIFNASLATLYVMGILLLFQNEKWKPRLGQLYALGRMGLTTYLMQTLFGVLLFFPIGLGMLNELGVLPCLLIGLAVFTFQIQFSKWWLKRFRFGPVEWLWRSLTYMKVQPMN